MIKFAQLHDAYPITFHCIRSIVLHQTTRDFIVSTLIVFRSIFDHSFGHSPAALTQCEFWGKTWRYCQYALYTPIQLDVARVGYYRYNINHVRVSYWALIYCIFIHFHFSFSFHLDPLALFTRTVPVRWERFSTSRTIYIRIMDILKCIRYILYYMHFISIRSYCMYV